MIAVMEDLGDESSVCFLEEILNPSASASSSHRTTSDVAASREQYDRALFSASIANAQNSELKLPWEQGIFGVICGDKPFSLPADPLDVPVFSSHTPIHPEEPARLDTQRGVKRSVELPLHASVVKCLRDEDAGEQLSRLWGTAVAKWYAIFDNLGYPGSLGSAIGHCGDNESEACEIIRDALSIRSPRTAIKRALIFSNFVTWLQAQDEEYGNLSRGHVLKYLTPGEGFPIAPTVGTSLMECFRFAHYVLDVQVPNEVLQDRQILGRVQRLRVTGDYTPARDMLTCEVAMMERAMVTLSDPWDKYLLGCLLFALYSRSRWSDLQHLHNMWVERHEMEGAVFGFVEARTKFHKTGSAMEKKLRFMPLVCPLLGITDTDWTKFWFESMKLVGLDYKQQPLGALCRAPLEGGLLGMRSITSDEATQFLNKLLHTDSSNKLSSHSLKHTTLSWCSKYGLKEDSRTLLGHHELPSKSLTVYSRDVLTRPLQQYCAMLLNLRNGNFHPDSTRAIWMGLAGAAVAPPCPPVTEVSESDLGGEEPILRSQLEQVEQSDDAASVASSDSSASSEDSDTLLDVVQADDKQNDVASQNDIAGPVWLNARSSTVHKVGLADHVTYCGRRVVGGNFIFHADGTTSLNPRYTLCYEGEAETACG